MRRTALAIAALLVLAHTWFAITLAHDGVYADFDFSPHHVVLSLWFQLVAWRGFHWGVPIAGLAAILWLADQRPPRRGLERGLAAVLAITAVATAFVTYFGD